jgi:hypothetical protein
MPATTLHMIPITWPFAVWGLDMMVLTQILSSNMNDKGYEGNMKKIIKYSAKK